MTPVLQNSGRCRAAAVRHFFVVAGGLVLNAAVVGIPLAACSLPANSIGPLILFFMGTSALYLADQTRSLLTLQPETLSEFGPYQQQTGIRARWRSG